MKERKSSRQAEIADDMMAHVVPVQWWFISLLGNDPIDRCAYRIKEIKLQRTVIAEHSFHFGGPD